MISTRKTNAFIIWIVVFITYYSVGINSNEYNLFVPLSLTILQFVVYMANRRFVIPRYYEDRKPVFFITNVILFIVLIVIMTQLGEIVGTPPKSIAHRENLPPPNIIFIALFHTSLGLIALWAAVNQYLLEKEKRNEKEIETLKRINIENNLQLLKSQINPHFLFNALNNIYTMSYMGDKSTPNKIDKLSDMLRFVLYDCESEYIPLMKEIEYINNYIEFQQLKTEFDQCVSFKYNIESEGFLIAPMILIPFIENAFKYSGVERNTSNYIDIFLIQTKHKLSFKIINTIKDNNEAFIKKENQYGIGIKNVKNRLNIIYPNSHELLTEKTNELYIVDLKIIIDEARRKV